MYHKLNFFELHLDNFFTAVKRYKESPKKFQHSKCKALAWPAVFSLGSFNKVKWPEITFSGLLAEIIMTTLDIFAIFGNYGQLGVVCYGYNVHLCG